jgi:hypothetical protein
MAREARDAPPLPYRNNQSLGRSATIANAQHKEQRRLFFQFMSAQAKIEPYFIDSNLNAP